MKPFQIAPIVIGWMFVVKVSAWWSDQIGYRLPEKKSFELYFFDSKHHQKRINKTYYILYTHNRLYLRESG